jgi:hypothetical protein
MVCCELSNPADWGAAGYLRYRLLRPLAITLVMTASATRFLNSGSEIADEMISFTRRLIAPSASFTAASTASLIGLLYLSMSALLKHFREIGFDHLLNNVCCNCYVLHNFSLKPAPASRAAQTGTG